MRGRRRRARPRSGALETCLGLAVLMAWLVGFHPWLVGVVVGVLIMLDITVAAVRHPFVHD